MINNLYGFNNTSFYTNYILFIILRILNCFSIVNNNYLKKMTNKFLIFILNKLFEKVFFCFFCFSF